jgi:hypothetical protein
MANFFCTFHHDRIFIPACRGCPDCKEDAISTFPEIKLRGLGPSFHIHVSVSDLHIPTTYFPAAE